MDTNQKHVTPLAYSVEDAAEALALSVEGIYELIRSHQLRTIKCGRRRLVPLVALNAYIEHAMDATA